MVGCMAVPIHTETKSLQRKTTAITINKSYDVLWTKILIALFSEGCVIKSKDKTDGNIIAELNGATLTNYDLKDKTDTISFAIADKRKRVSNNNVVIPRTAILQYSIMLIKENENVTQMIISLENKCTVTSYFENTFIVNRLIPNVQIISTGLFEKKISDYLK